MDSLKKLGLTKYEISIYETLLKDKRLSAREISERSKVPPTAVYPNLNSLREKKFIQKIEGNPSVFEILSPKAAINRLVNQRKKSLDTLETQAINDASSIFSKNPSIKEKEIIKLTKGKEFSSEIYYDFMKRAQKTFFILGWRFEKIGDRYTVLKGYKEIIKRKVDVRIIVTGTYQKNKELINAYKDAGIKLRFFPADNFSIVVVDAKECKITLKNRDFPEKYNLQIKDSSLSQALHSYFLDTWEKAKPI